MSVALKPMAQRVNRSNATKYCKATFLLALFLLHGMLAVSSFGQDIPLPTQNNGQQNQRPLPSVSISNPLNLTSRSINVHVTGDVPLTGVYKVPVGARVDEVLFGFDILNKQSALEQATLDFRNVLVFTQDGDTLSSDLLAYNYGGKLSENVIVNDGDVIHIRQTNPRFERVSISGEVVRSLDLPFKEGETFEDLLEIAGGFSDYAWTDEIVMFSPERSVMPLSSALSYQVQPNDRFIIRKDDSKRPESTIKLAGEVLQPGIYPIVEDETLLEDILLEAGGYTKNPSNLSIIVHRKDDDSKREQSRQAEEELQRFQTDLLRQSRTLRVTPDQLRMSDQYLENFQLFFDELDMEQTFLYVQPENIPSEAITLADQDSIEVRYTPSHIRLMGQVSKSGFYPLEEGKTVDEYIAEAGGLGPASDEEGIYVIKNISYAWVPAEEATLEPGDILFVDRTPITTYEVDQQLEIQRLEAQLERQESRFRTVISTVNALVSVVLLLTRL
jgi:protein involved in polysaccharide export with SLBB domain